MATLDVPMSSSASTSQTATYTSSSASSAMSGSSVTTSSTILSDSSSAIGSTVLRFKDVKAWVPNYKETQADGTKASVTRTILKGVSGTVRSGGLTMLMGASGAGKSTFFDVLAHRTSKGVHYSGSITVNGQEFTLEDFQNTAAYVTQDSYFVADLTVRETLQFQASVRLPQSVGADEVARRIADVLSLLRLVDYEHTRVTELNPASRKKLAIGCALLGNPELLFCDEPTTSLDATTARSVIASLRNVAASRRVLIFCTIHQPSYQIFSMFNTALVMALGQMAYEGPVSELVPRLASIGHKCPRAVNPADFVIDLLSGRAADTKRAKAVQEVIDALAGSTASGASASGSRSDAQEINDARPVFESRPGFFSLTTSLLKRNLRVTTRNDKALKANIGQSIMLGLVLGFLFYQSPRNQAGANDRVGFMFLVSSNSMFLAVQAAIVVAVSERAVFLKEVSEGSYGALAYLLAKALALIPFQVFYASLFSAIVYFIVGLQGEFINWLHFTLFLVLVSLCGSAFGLFISVMTGDVATANALSPAVGIPSMLFSGFVVTTDAIPIWLRWLRYLSMVRYSLSGLIINEMDGLAFTCNADERLPSGDCPISTGDQMIKLVRANENGTQLWVRYLGLCCVYVFAISIAYLAMVLKARAARRGK